MFRSLLRLIVPILLAMLATACTSLPEASMHPFQARTVSVDGTISRYQVFVPAAAAQATGPLPVVLFLHGSGERGHDGSKQTEAGIGPYLRAHAAGFPAIVVLPQVPENQEWAGHNNRVALAALDAAMKEFNGDPARQYLTGMSMGGYGSWNIALDAPTRFAAVVPVCGAVLAPREERPTLYVTSVAQARDPYAVIAQRLKHVPVWLFHGALDDVVPPADDRRLVAAFKAAGAREVRYTEYPQGNHNAWDATYADPTMWQWLFAQRN